MNGVEADVIWCAGFFEGEGTVSKQCAMVRVNQREDNPEPIRRLHRTFGGSIRMDSRQYARDRGRNVRDQLQWTACGDTARAAMRAMIPHMVGPKIEEMRPWL